MEDEPELMDRLRNRTRLMRDGLAELGFRLEETVTPIIPVLIGDDETTFRMAGALEDEGVVVNPIVPPAVPAEGSLIRVSMMASLSEDEIGRALSMFGSVGRKLGVI